jgi:hypothetical protein
MLAKYMKCKIDITAATDIAAWVTRDAFMANVDMVDLAYRESEVVHDWYHPEWFRHSDDGELYFTPPAFEFRNGCLRGINGRHRAILLFRHLEAIPMLLVASATWPKGKLSEIMQRRIGNSDTIQLPNLPINTSVQDLGETSSADEAQKAWRLSISLQI